MMYERMRGSTMKRITAVCCALVLVAVGFSGCNDSKGVQQQPKDVDVVETKAPEVPQFVSADKLPVSRALVAKMLALAFNSKNAIETLDREISFSDTSPTDWYDKYINTCCIQGYMSGTREGFFEPDAYLTLQQAQYLIDRIDKNNKIKIKITSETKDKPISYALWTELYTKALKNAYNDDDLKAQYGLEEDSFVVMVTAEQYGKLKPWVAITDTGKISYEGLQIDQYTDTRIKVLRKDDEIVAFLELESTEPVILNAYVVGCTQGDITIFTGGVLKRYSYKNDLDQGKASGAIADVKIKRGSATAVTLYEETMTGVMKVVDEAYVEVDQDGVTKQVPLTDVKVYAISDNGPKWRELKDVIVGGSGYKIFLKEGNGCAIVFGQKPTLANMRVSISTTNFAGLLHDTVAITSDTAYSVEAGGDTKKYEKGQVLTISKTENADLFGQQRIYIKPLDEKGKIQINSIQRNMKNSPQYRGVIEIGKKDGGYTIVNELPLEKYLYNVVPSEMPASYGLEGLKVQAVAARSYAYNQFYVNAYAKYGGNINDSASSQVYNNIEENEVANSAIEETKGQCIAYEGNIITAFYFSTSAGVTTNAGEVWNDRVTKRFPATTPEYLKAKEQYIGADYGDLTVEENMANFIKSTNVQSYDTQSSWFRWNITMTAADLTESINRNLKKRYETDTTLVKTLQNGSNYRSRPIESIGKIKDLEVTKRGAGGVVMEMKIVGDQNTILVSTQTAITNLIRPIQYNKDKESITVNLKNGSTIKDSTCIPSGFFIIEKKTDESGNLQSVQFFGGGYGHGVGMSQNGTLGMVQEGYTYTDILKHYYNGTELKNIY